MRQSYAQNTRYRLHYCDDTKPRFPQNTHPNEYGDNNDIPKLERVKSRSAKVMLWYLRTEDSLFIRCGEIYRHISCPEVDDLPTEPLLGHVTEVQ